MSGVDNITGTKHKHSLICVFLLQSDAERPDPGRVSPLLLLPSQHKQKLTVLARTAGGLHCRRTGESPSNERNEVHSFRYCSHALIWMWHRSMFLVMFKTFNNRHGSAQSFTWSYFECFIPPSCQYHRSSIVTNSASHSGVSDFKFHSESRLSWFRSL
jgi:hypothetical protein